MNPKWRKRAVILVILLAGFTTLRITVFRTKPIEIEAYTISAGRVEETVTNSKAGTIKTRKRAKLSPEMGGRVAYLGAKEGMRVKTGDLLLRLDDSELRASLSLAQRAWQAATANSKEACVAAELAVRELERNRALSQQGIVSESTLDQASNRSTAAAARCQAFRAEAKRAEAAVDVARANLNRTELRAPFDGVIAQVSTEAGEWITPSPPGVPLPPVIDILDNKSIYVTAPMDETDAAKLQTGLSVRIRLEPYPEQIFPGKLIRVAPFVLDVEGQNRTVEVEAEFNDQNFATTLLPGTSADVEVILRARENVLRIPTYALMEGNRVLLVSEDKLVAKPVKTGLRNWEFVEITDGLRKGERIAVSLDRAEVKQGARVRVGGEAAK